MSNEKVNCTECNWFGLISEIDRVNDPRSDEVWNVCPDCRMPEHICTVCDVKDCKQLVTCGTPTKDGYRCTCGKHRPGK